MTSYSTLFLALVFGVILFLTILLFGKMKLDNFLPLFTQPLTKYLEGTHVVIALPVCEILVVFAIFPNLKNPQGVGKAFWGGLALGGFLFLIVITRDTAVLGPLVNFESLPSYSVIRSINIGNILTRLEVLYALILIMLLFYKITIFYYACVYGVSQLLNLEAYQFLVLIFGVLIVIFSLNVFQSGFEEDQFGSTGPATYFATFFELILPTLTLIVAAIRSHFCTLGD